MTSPSWDSAIAEAMVWNCWPAPTVRVDIGSISPSIRTHAPVPAKHAGQTSETTSLFIERLVLGTAAVAAHRDVIRPRDRAAEHVVEPRVDKRCGKQSNKL